MRSLEKQEQENEKLKIIKMTALLKGNIETGRAEESEVEE